MRPMLISLILICSLAQFASAGAAPVEVDSGGCGTVYTCFVPEKCKKPTVTTMADSEVVGIQKNENMILNDCDAIIRIYRYDARKTYVSIESFQDTVKKIVFKQQADDATQTLLGLFSCEFDVATGKKRGIFFDKIVLDEDSSSGKLKCTFEHNREAPHAGEKFMAPDDFLSIATTNWMNEQSSTQVSHYPNEVPVRCDPENFDFFRPEEERTKLYKEVSTKNKPEKYECEDAALFKMEYKKKGSINYEIAKDIKCVDSGDKFQVYDTSGQDPKFDSRFEDSFEIRCFAETKFFCKDSLKLKDGMRFPELATNADGSSLLECPPDKPHLVVVGEVARYITNPEFKCVTLGNDPIWTVQNGAREEHFTKTGPTVYCTDRKNCTQSIAESAVVGGTLGPDFLPKCFEGGALKTSDNKDVTSTRCDYSIGQYKYTSGGEEKEINGETKFSCEYPTFDDEIVAKKDQEHKDKILNGGLYAGLVSGIVGVVVIVVVVLLLRRRVQRDKIIYELKQRENQELYYTPKELAAVRKQEAKQNKQNLSQSMEKSRTTEKTIPKVEEKINTTHETIKHMVKTFFMPVNGYVPAKLSDNQNSVDIRKHYGMSYKPHFHGQEEHDKASNLVHRIKKKYDDHMHGGKTKAVDGRRKGEQKQEE